jgi:predicted Zn-dependent peptidase
MNYKHKLYSNGLNVLTVHVPEAESVVFTVYVKVGSRYENEKIAGIAHYLEHVFFKGSRNYPYSSSISSLVDGVGGDFNASTSKENTEFYIKTSKTHFDMIFDILTDMILNPLFDEKELEKEKGVVIEEINMYQDNPGAQAENNLESIMWPDSPLGRDIIGTHASIRALTKKQVFEFKNKFYQPGNIILGVAGNFDPKKVAKKVENTWARLENKKVGTFKKATDKQAKPNLHIEYKATKQAHMALGFKSFPHDHKKNAATFLLASILGGSMSSRLFMNIREQKGLAYYIRASNSAYFNTGNFTIHAGLKIDSTLEALREVLMELRKVKSEIVIDAELKKAKDYIKGKVALGLEDTHQKLDWVLDSFAVRGRVKTPQEFFQQLDTINAKDIQDVANEIFVNEKMSLALVGPFKNKKSFEKELYIKENF